MLDITIAGPNGSGKSWVAPLLKAVLTEILGCQVQETGEDMDSHTLARRQFQLMAGAIRLPLHGQEARIHQVTVARAPQNAEGRPVGPTLESHAESLAEKLEALERYLPTGAKRDAFAAAYAAICEVREQLQKAKSL